MRQNRLSHRLRLAVQYQPQAPDTRPVTTGVVFWQPFLTAVVTAVKTAGKNIARLDGRQVHHDGPS